MKSQIFLKRRRAFEESRNKEDEYRSTSWFVSLLLIRAHTLSHSLYALYASSGWIVTVSRSVLMALLSIHPSFPVDTTCGILTLQTWDDLHNLCSHEQKPLKCYRIRMHFEVLQSNNPICSWEFVAGWLTVAFSQQLQNFRRRKHFGWAAPPSSQLSASSQDEIHKDNGKFCILHFNYLQEDFSDSISYCLQNFSNLLYFKIPVSFQGDRMGFLSLDFPLLLGNSVASLNAVKTQKKSILLFQFKLCSSCW